MQNNNIYGRAVSGRSGTLAPGSELKAIFVAGRGKGGKGGSFSEIQTKKEFCAEKVWIFYQAHVLRENLQKAHLGVPGQGDGCGLFCPDPSCG